jgi:hypothetical protein
MKLKYRFSYDQDTFFQSVQNYNTNVHAVIKEMILGLRFHNTDIKKILVAEQEEESKE